jgi:hypothetical protein
MKAKGVYDLLINEGNFQAKVIKEIAPFKKGQDVHLEATHNGMVSVMDIETESICEEYNLDTHEEYDKYFKVY